MTNRGYDKDVYYAAVNEGTTDKSKESNDESSLADDNNCVIKGNINSKGNKIYHMPGQRNYDKTVAEDMFCTEEEAQAAGFKAASP